MSTGKATSNACDITSQLAGILIARPARAESFSIYLSIYLPSYHYCALCATGGDLARTGRTSAPDRCLMTMKQNPNGHV